jgi:hypothetical protein
MMGWTEWVLVMLGAMFGACVGLLGAGLAVAIRRADDAALGMPDLEGLEGGDEGDDEDGWLGEQARKRWEKGGIQ